MLSRISRWTRTPGKFNNNITIRSYLLNIFLRIEELYCNIIFDKKKLSRALLSPKLWLVLVVFAFKVAFPEYLLLDDGNESSDKSGGEGTGGRDRTSTGSSPTDPSDSSATEVTLTIRKRKVDSDSVDMDLSKKPKKD